MEGSDENNECSICLEEKKNEIKLICKHTFCHSCIYKEEKLIYENCPLCRNLIIEYSDYEEPKNTKNQEMKEFDTIIECCACYENHLAAKYRCKCMHRNLCEKCYKQVKMCPFCLEKIT